MLHLWVVRLSNLSIQVTCNEVVKFFKIEHSCLLAGVATAFAAPIGGLLFTIEEGASFYSTSIFWRGFLSTCIGVLTLHFLVSCAVSHSLLLPSCSLLVLMHFNNGIMVMSHLAA